MKKFTLLLVFALVAIPTFAQDSLATATDSQTTKLKVFKPRPKYINLNFVSQEIKADEGDNLKTQYGAAFTVGRTFYLNKNKPLLKIIRFGIDATWLDLNYGNYCIEEGSNNSGSYYDEPSKNTIHQGEVSMHVGPSITITPIESLNLHGYFRFAPSFAMMYVNEEFKGDYGSFFLSGVSLSYGVIGMGIEKRWGSSAYNDLLGEDDENYSSTAAKKLNTSGFRLYITFRF